MSLIHKVTAAMAEIAPLALADRSWDNVGVLVESPDGNKSNKVMLTIDLTPEVMEECLRKNVEVILSYHPPIFSSFKRLTLQDPKQKIVLQTVRAGMSIYSPHTSLDATEGGINDWLASLLDPSAPGTAQVRPIAPAVADPKLGAPDANTKTGVGRLVTLAQPLPFATMVSSIKEGLSIPTVRVAVPAGWEPTRPVRRVAICAGSGTSVFRMVKEPVDVLFSGEMGHHDVLAANAAGQAVILCEHTNTERGYLANQLQPKLQQLLGDVEILISEKDHDPLVVW